MSQRTNLLLASFALVIFLNLFGFLRDLPALLPEPKPVDFPVYYVAASILNNGQAEHLYDEEFQKLVAVFPTRVGVNRQESRNHRRQFCVPHTRAGEPTDNFFDAVRVSYSPHAWG